MELFLYTDGSSSNTKTRCGGWAAVLVAYKDGVLQRKVEFYGGAADTTNIRMEMTAIIEGLKALKWESKITIVCDLELIVNTMVHGFKRKANPDLWREIDKLSASHDITWTWVKGHDGNEWNEVVDKLAVAARKNFENLQIANP